MQGITHAYHHRSTYLTVWLAVCWLTGATASAWQTPPLTPAADKTQVAAASATPAEHRSEQAAWEVRVPWTTSRLFGSPDRPAPYRVEPALTDYQFERPVVITGWPADKRMFVVEQGGRIYWLDASVRGGTDHLPRGRTPGLVADLKHARPELRSIFGLAFHPRVVENRFVFISYVDGARDREEGTRVSRFLLSSLDPPRLDPSTEQVLVAWRSGGHNGGCLKFGPDGYLYLSTGDAAPPTPPDGLTAGQDIGNLLSAILRIDVDGTSDGAAYRVPADNPFVDLPGARPEIWAYGFRNPWKMSFDRRTGDLWVGDVGWELWEMIYRVEKAGNYGWSIREGRQSVRPEQEPGPTPILPPTIDHPHSEAGSITGGFVYRGKRLSELTGAYVYGDYQSGIIWDARHDGQRIIWHRELARTSLRLVGFGEHADGELYLLDYQGRIYQLARNPVADTSASFPRRLSDTGLFASVADQRPAGGVVPYSIRVPAWADGTRADRWLAVPGTGWVTVDALGNWQFPDGSVVAKTISIDDLVAVDGQSVAASTLRLETQILHREAGSWQAYSYAWHADQADAELVEADGLSRSITVSDATAPSGTREQTYRFAGRQECVLCHNPWVEARTTVFGLQSASLLAVRCEQLDQELPLAGDTINQLDALQRQGVLAPLPPPVRAAARLSDPFDPELEPHARARSYLQVNCAHCHQFNAGGVATIVLSRDVPLDQARLVGERPSQGTFGITDARLIAPRDPFGSVLLYRVAKLGGGRMPRLGSHAVDDRAVVLLHDWIAGLASTGATALPVLQPEPPGLRHGHSPELVAATRQLEDNLPAAARAAAITQLTSSTRGALGLAYLLSAGRLSPLVRRQVAELAGNHPDVAVRDLFERHVPLAERRQRLGDNVDLAKLLALPADAERGRAVFFQENAAACKNCHRIGESGQTLGPDLGQIGKKYTRPQLLQHVLEPSRFMEPQYVPYLVETIDGRIVTGLLASQTDAEFVVKDAQNKLHRISREDVELLVRQQRSLMPDLLLRDLSPQQVADLVAFLASQR